MSQQDYSLFVEAIKANSVCKSQRKNYNLSVANPISKYIQPQLAKKQAQSLVNCFHNMLSMESESQIAKKSLAIQSLMRGQDATKLVHDYVVS